MLESASNLTNPGLGETAWDVQAKTQKSTRAFHCLANDRECFLLLFTNGNCPFRVVAADWRANRPGHKQKKWLKSAKQETKTKHITRETWQNCETDAIKHFYSALFLSKRAAFLSLVGRLVTDASCIVCCPLCHFVSDYLAGWRSAFLLHRTEALAASLRNHWTRC